MNTLLKLTETKSQQSRVTLLHHVLEVGQWDIGGENVEGSRNGVQPEGWGHTWPL